MKNKMLFLSKISGILIFLSFITTLYSYFFQANILIISGILAWMAFFILFPTLKNKRIIIILLSLSFLAFFICYINSYQINLIKVFTVNQYLLTLLIGVGFLRLIAIPRKDKNIDLPKG